MILTLTRLFLPSALLDLCRFSTQSSGSLVSRTLKVKTEPEPANTSSGSSRSSRTHVSAGIPSFSGANHSVNGSQGAGYGHQNSSNASSSNHVDGSNGNKYGSHFTSLYASPAPSAHTISSATSRRMTVGGGGDGSYYGGPSSSRKNTTSLYVAGSSNTIGTATRTEYLRQANASSTSRRM